MMHRFSPQVADDDEDADDAFLTPPSADEERKQRGLRRHQINESPDLEDSASGEEMATKAVKDICVKTYSYMSPISSDIDDIPQSTFRRDCTRQAGKWHRGPPPTPKSAEKEEPKRGRKARQVERRGLHSPDGCEPEPKSGISKVARKRRGRPKQAKDLPVSTHLEMRLGTTRRSTTAKQQNNKHDTSTCLTELVPEPENEVTAKTAKKQKAATSRTSRGRHCTTSANAGSSEHNLCDLDNTAESERSESPGQTLDSMSDESRSCCRSEETSAEAEKELDTKKVKTGNDSRKTRKFRDSSASSSMDEGSKKRAAKQRIKRTQKCRRRALPASSCESKLSVCPAVHLSRKKERKAQWGRGPIECEVCGRSIRCRAIMERHMLTHTGEKPFECGDCGRRYTSSSNLRIHQLSHSGAMDFVCNECGQKFTHLPYLKRHLLRHAGKKMHMCDQCGKGFIQKYHLERHLLLHTGKTPYTCDECGATFTRTDYLRMHMRNTHLGHGKRAETVPSKSHKCDTCEKAFTSRSVLEAHMRVHTGDAPFRCSICMRRFKQSSHMSSHMRTHTGEKPYICDVCGLRFTRRSYVRVHKRKVHGASDQVPSC
ncbi:zinc finger protein 2-like isoform X2 [Electrophorus electricus]|uniref:zinc finger protein 2-like isoform X2 n=1 Tax=Electrophorus electricus TaxID=8005 RepID=UPI0015D09521|nr:zinc finger protein 2-like isoform X2 [Electrophorus electricus]